MQNLCVFAAVAALLCAAAHAGPQPKFPADWTATQTDTLVAQQGPVQHVGGFYCCSEKANCEVQVQYESGQHYYDYSHNRTRFDDKDAKQTTVTLYDRQITMLVVNQTCKEYCPLQGEYLDPGFLFVNATDMGQGVTPDGRRGERWNWKEYLAHIIVMEITDVIVDQTDMQNGIPLSEVDKLTPFGIHIGDFTSTWQSFKPGTPDPSLFIVNGIDRCPMSPNCGNTLFQMNRLRLGQHATFMSHHQSNALAAAAAAVDLHD